jgi:hypothetical protein
MFGISFRPLSRKEQKRKERERARAKKKFAKDKKIWK